MMLNKDELLEIGAILLAGLAVFLFMRHGTSAGSSVAAPITTMPQNTGTYLTFNQPAIDSGAQTSLSNVVPANLQPAAQIQQPCACGGSPVQYGDTTSFTSFLNAQDENAISRYYNTVIGSLPSWMTEFINNTLAPDETAASQGAFSQLAGGQ